MEIYTKAVKKSNKIDWDQWGIKNNPKVEVMEAELKKLLTMQHKKDGTNHSLNNVSSQTRQVKINFLKKAL